MNLLAALLLALSIVKHDGVTTIVQQDDAAPLVHVSLVVPGGLDRQTLSQSGIAALTAQTILRTNVDGVPLEDAVAARGGSVHFFVDPSDVRFAIEALPNDAPAVLTLVQRALAAPGFDGKTVSSARTELTAQIAQSQQIALQVGLDMLYSSRAKNANQGMPALGIPAVLAQLGPNETRAFFSKYYRRSGSYLSVAGRVDALPSDALSSLVAALGAGDSPSVNASLPKLEGSTRQIVTHRDVAAPWLIAQYPAPPVDSPDFGPMLVLATFMQRTLSDIAQVPGVVSQSITSRAVGAIYQFDRTDPNLTLYVNGSIGNPNRAFATALSVASLLAATKLQGSIDDFKAGAAGDFVSGSTSLESRAWLAYVFSRNGKSADFSARALDAIAATTPADLQRVAKKYLGDPTIALILPRDSQ